MSRLPPSFLIVDDNPQFVELLSTIVRRTYPEAVVGIAGTGEETMERLAERAWDVVLLDYNLPDIDGLEVLGEIRKLDLDLAVVVVTGEGDEALVADLFRMGAYDYLTKGGITAAAIRRTLDQTLTRQRLQREIASQSDELVATSRALDDKARALDVAYENLREKKEQLRHLADSLEATVQERTAELQATTDFVNRVLDSTLTHFIMATGPDGKLRVFNRGAEQIFRRPAEEVVGRLHFRELFEELEDDPGALLDIRAELQQHGLVQRTMTGVAGVGRSFTAQLTLTRLAAGDEGGLVLIGSDVTHERELEAQNQAYIRQIEMANEDLRRKNREILESARLKSEFLANVSHELRTPLNAIIGYSDLLREGVYGELPARPLRAVEGVHGRAKDLLGLINGILDLAKVEAGRIDLRPERFLLREVVLDVLETGRILLAAANKRALEIGWEDERVGDVELWTDRQKLRQILLNLVNNAVKFTAEGAITLRTRAASEDELEVAVHDTGIGIPEDEVERIFDHFRQVDGTSTREFGGTGLGLAISRSFAEHLGGALWAESRLGEGSIFRLHVPVEAPGAAELSSTPTPAVQLLDDLE